MNESLTNDELNGAWQVETSAPMITHWVSDIGMTNVCAIFPVTMLVLHMILEWLIYTWYIPDSSIRDTLDDLSGGNCCANPPLWASPCLRTTKDLSDQQRPAVLAQKRHFLEREKAPKSLRTPCRLNSKRQRCSLGAQRISEKSPTVWAHKSLGSLTSIESVDYSVVVKLWSEDIGSHSSNSQKSYLQQQVLAQKMPTISCQ